MKSHRINFFEPKPQGIRYVAYDDVSNRIGVSRSDNSVEIWNLNGNPSQEKIIPGDNTLSVEGLSWCAGRLFTCGLHGYVLEYDLQNLLLSHQLLITSGCPIWCIEANKKRCQLAIGNEEGYVSLIDVIPSGLVYNKRFDKQEGSILCLAWHKEGNIIATGSADVIRTWDVETGHVINRIMLSRVSKNTPTIVWCIALIKDMTIVSGDSSGKTSFWDGHTGTLISSPGAKKGDILSIAVSEKEDIIYTSGVDPTITSFMPSHSNGVWMKSIQRIVHTHDVRALQLVGDILISGGDDCNLVCTKYPPKTVITFYPFCQKSHAVVALQASCILLQYPSAVELWKIGQNDPVHLLRIKPKTSETIICSSISPDGKWIVFSTQQKLRVFSICQNPDVENSVSMSKVELPSSMSPCSIISFYKNSSRFVAYDGHKLFVVMCYHIADVEYNIELQPEDMKKIHKIEISGNDEILACASYDGDVIIVCLQSLQELCRLPAYRCPATALAFDQSSKNLTVAYSDRKIVEYNIDKQVYTKWSKQETSPTFKEASLYPITSMCFSHDRLCLIEENVIYIFDRTNTTSPASKKLKQSGNAEKLMTSQSFKTIRGYEHLSSIHSLNNELVLIQIPSKIILQSLPPPIWKKVYGT